MKTFKQTIKKPKLVIEYDEYSSSPRDWDNLGYFITIDKNYYSPDKHEIFEEIIKDNGEIATSQEDHVKRIKEEIEETQGEKVIEIYPVSKYEHSGVSYSLGEKHGFDYSNNGFYIITDKTQKEVGTKKKDFEKVIKDELNIYNQWLNGEVYKYVLYNDNGEITDSCGGFYDIEDIKEHLPKDWEKEKMKDYLIN